MLFGAFFVNAAQSSNSSARIDGVTDFLIDRANETYFYIFENKMKNNEKFSCYFPETYEYIKEGDLKALIKTKDIFSEALDNDFKILSIRAVAHGINKSIDFNKVAMEATNEYAEILRYLKIKIGNEQYSLSFIPISANKETRDIINGFYDEFNNIRDEMLGFDNKLSKYGKTCSQDRPVKDELIKEIEKLEKTYKSLEDWLAHINKYKSKVKVDLAEIEKDCKIDPKLKVCELKDKAFNEILPKLKESFEKPVVKAVAGIVILNKYIKNIKKRTTYTGKVVEAFKVIKDKKLEDKPTLKKLKHYALFIAQVADSNSPDQVQGLLKEYALPVTSFLAKREPGEKSLMISAYFGYGAGAVLNDDDIPSDNMSGFYVPVGFEFSKGLSDGSSISLMLSPVDFGYPVSLKLNGEVEDVESDDIIAPSISIAYGIKDYPVNVGLAFQKGRKFALQNKEEKRIMIFVAFDMPLFSF
jgi:hypothetical protein